MEIVGLPDYSRYRSKLLQCTEIYRITTPSDKEYIGKAVCFSGRVRKSKHGTQGRWRQHLSNRSTCALLKGQIKKYWDQLSNFKVEVILICPTKDEDYYERLMIQQFNTHYYKNPSGLNLEEGGTNGFKVSDETIQKRVESMKIAWKTREVRSPTDKTREEIRVTNLKNAIARREARFQLPPFIKPMIWKDDSKGFQIIGHPLLKDKKVSCKNPTNDDYQTLLRRAIEYLNTPPSTAFRKAPTLTRISNLQQLPIPQKLIKAYEIHNQYRFQGTWEKERHKEA